VLRDLIEDVEPDETSNHTEQTLDDDVILLAEAASANNTDNTGRRKATSPLPQRPPNKAQKV